MNALQIKLHVQVIFWVLQRCFFSLITVHYTIISNNPAFLGWLNSLFGGSCFAWEFATLLCTEQLVKLSKYYEIIWKHSVSAKLLSQSFGKTTPILNHIFGKNKNKTKQNRITRYLPGTQHFTYLLFPFLHIVIKLGEVGTVLILQVRKLWYKEFNKRLQVVNGKGLFAPKPSLSFWTAAPPQTWLCCSERSCLRCGLCQLAMGNPPLSEWVKYCMTC